MNVYPLYLVLGSDGTIGAYAREDLLTIDLATHKMAGEPARQVFKLDEGSMAVTYDPTNEYAEFVVSIENLCPRHLREALPKPTQSTCSECKKEQKANGKTANV